MGLGNLMSNDKRTLQQFIQRQKLMNNPLALDPMAQHIVVNKAAGPLLSTDFFTTTYGKKVWDALNNQTRFWNLLRKVPWGDRTGWRIRTGRNLSTTAIDEDCTIPAVMKSTFQTVYSEPRIIITPFGVTLKAQFLGRLEGGLGDVLAIEQENSKTDHLKWINQALLSGAHGVVTTAGASGVAVVRPAGFLRPGDTFQTTTGSGMQTGTVVSHNATTGVLAFTGTANLVDGNAVTVASRLGPTSLDDIVEEDGRTMAGANSTGVDVYNLTSRPSMSFAAATVLDNDGVLRDLSTNLIDQAIRAVRDRGGEPDLILTGSDMLDKLSSLLAGQQRFLDQGEFRVKFGDETTLPGTKAGFQVATYKGIPVFPEPDIARSYTEPGALGGSKVYVLDSRYLEIAVAAMTQYQEDSGYTAVLCINGFFTTMFELRCYDMTKQAKIEDLNAF